MTPLAAQLHIVQRFLHTLVSFGFVSGLGIATMAVTAEIAKGVRLVPGFIAIAHRLFALHIVAILARRSLRATLGFGGGVREEHSRASKDEGDNEERKPVK